MPDTTLHILAPAKVNLHLGVHDELNERGYHYVDSVMACLDLYDRVSVEDVSGGVGEASDAVNGLSDESVDDVEAPGGARETSDACQITVSCTPDVGVPQESNTCYRAAQLLGEEFGVVPQVRIHVEKNIPDQAGLGASSSDAAATLLGLCQLWGIDPHDKRVFHVAAQVGADVPFFLVGTPAYLEGAGDTLVESYPQAGKVLKELNVALVRPKGPGITAAGAYEEFDRKPVSRVRSRGIRDALQSGDVDEIVFNMANNLEAVAFRLAPDLEAYVDWAASIPGVARAMVTGSGTCFFCICDTEDAAIQIADEARDADLWACATHFISGGVAFEE